MAATETAVFIHDCNKSFAISFLEKYQLYEKSLWNKKCLELAKEHV